MSTLLTLETLKEHLEKIDYSIRGSYPNRFIFNHKGENLWIRVWNDNIKIEGAHTSTIVFVFDKSPIRMIENTTVSIGEEHSFINLYNFTKNT